MLEKTCRILADNKKQSKNEMSIINAWFNLKIVESENSVTLKLGVTTKSPDDKIPQRQNPPTTKSP